MALQAVVALLVQARSNDDAVRKPAEVQIIQYFDQPGFGSFLCVRNPPFIPCSDCSFNLPLASVLIILAVTYSNLPRQW